VSTGNAYYVRNDKLKKLKNYDETLTLSDYHTSDDLVNSVLQNLDKDGNIRVFTHSHRWISDEYNEIIKLEKEKIL
jgi:hypothetical protein